MAHMNDNATQSQTFKLDKPEYNMDTYTGRVKHFFNVFNPLNSLYTNSQISKMQETLQKHRNAEKEAEASGKQLTLT